MIYPIYLYGSSVLRDKCQDVESTHENLDTLINDMFDTMAAANGVGLAAPQIGKPLNLFVINLEEWEDEEGMPPVGDIRRRVFINPEIYERIGEVEKFKEGCLSLPGINEDVLREPRIRIRYMDENFQPHDIELDGMWARAAQHEYDHIKGIVFTDHLAPIRKSLIKSKLAKMTKGVYSAKYRCKNGN